jgi:hypothetical protein
MFINVTESHSRIYSVYDFMQKAKQIYYDLSL